MIEKLNELKKIVEDACDTPSVQQCNCPFNWTSVSFTLIGETNLNDASTFTYSIPSVIPSSAKEILIHAGLYSGSANNGPEQHIKIFTQIGTTRYEKYLLSYTYGQH